MLTSVEMTIIIYRWNTLMWNKGKAKSIFMMTESKLMFSETSYLILSEEDNPPLMHVRQIYKSHNFLESQNVSINI